MLARQFLGSPIQAWLVALAIAVGGWVLLVAIRHFAIRRLEAAATRTASAVDDVVLGALRRTSVAFLLALAFSAAEHLTHVLPPQVDGPFDVLVKLAALFQGANWGLGAIHFWVAHMAQRRAQDKSSVTTINVLAILLRFALLTVLLLLALDVFGVKVTALLTTLGIAGIAVALAVQNVLGDLFASLSIALDKPFVIGDTISVDDLTGTVEDIGLKTTRLRALSGERLVFSNADLLKSRIRNYRGQQERRVMFHTQLAPDTSPEKLERVPAIIREIVKGEAQARFDRSHVNAIGDASFGVETVYFVTSGDYAVYADMQQRVLLALLRRLEAEDIALARPTPPVTLVTPPDGTPPTAPRFPAAPSRPDTRPSSPPPRP